MKFQLVVKNGPQQLLDVEGREQDPKFISIADLEKVIEVEQWMERILGFRIHINMIQ